MIHVADAVKQGYHKVLAITMNTDVVVLAVTVVQELGNIEHSI